MPIINAEVTETTSITENGTYDVAKYTTANVDVQFLGISKSINQYGALGQGNTIINLNGVTSIGNFALYSAYTQNGNISGVVDFSSVQNITGSASLRSAFQGCPYITGVNLSGLVSISGDQNLDNAFNYAGSLNQTPFTIDLSNLQTVSSNLAFCDAFSGTNVNFVSFDRLTSITGGSTFMNAFRYCSGLKLLCFPVLSNLGDSTDHFNNMFQGIESDAVVRFPAALESVMASWQDVQNGFGAPNDHKPRVIFADFKMLPINITNTGGNQVYVYWDNYEHAGNYIDITGLDKWAFDIGSNNLIIVSTDRAAKIVVNVDSSTTSVDIDLSQIVYSEITVNARDTATGQYLSDYSAFATVVNTNKSLTVDANHKFYLGGTVTADAYCEQAGYISDLYSVQNSGVDQTVNVSMHPYQEVTYNASDVLQALTFSDEGVENYYSVNDGELLVHIPDNVETQFSAGLTLTVPNNVSWIRVHTTARVSSEANYDFGFLSIGSTQVVQTYKEIKAGTISDGHYMFRQSGQNNPDMTDVDYDEYETTNNVITIGWGQDKALRGDNTMYVGPITITYVF